VAWRWCAAKGRGWLATGVAVISELLARPGVELVHLRNVGYGCYNCAVRVHGD
jgi:Protein of unknown function (DUF1203)